MKFWKNLAVPSWEDPALGLGNAGFPGETVINYKVHVNKYGEYTDKYLTDAGKTNKHSLILTNDSQIVQKDSGFYHIPIKYATESYPMTYVKVPDIEKTSTHRFRDNCKGDKCDDGKDVSFYDFVGSELIEPNDRMKDEENFITTNTLLPVIPRLDGFMGTHG